METKFDFAEFCNKSDSGSMWRLHSNDAIFKAIEMFLIDDVTINWYVSDIAIVQKGVLVNWVKRYETLTDEEFEKMYGRLPKSGVIND